MAAALLVPPPCPAQADQGADLARLLGLGRIRDCGMVVLRWYELAMAPPRVLDREDGDLEDLLKVLNIHETGRDEIVLREDSTLDGVSLEEHRPSQ